MSLSNQDELSVHLRLGFLLHDVSRLRRSIVERELRPLGITRSQWWILAYLSRKDGQSQVALADDLEIAKAPLGALLDKLAGAGLIRREVDQRDRRVKRVFLTDLGVSTIRQIRSRIAAVERDIHQGIDATQLMATTAALREMKGNLLKALETSGGERSTETEGETPD